MPKYKRLADVDLLLAIDRTRVEIEGQKQMVAKLVAAAVESRMRATIGDWSTCTS